MYVRNSHSHSTKTILLAIVFNSLWNLSRNADKKYVSLSESIYLHLMRKTLGCLSAILGELCLLNRWNLLLTNNEIIVQVWIYLNEQNAQCSMLSVQGNVVVSVVVGFLSISFPELSFCHRQKRQQNKNQLTHRKCVSFSKNAHKSFESMK